MTLYKTLYMALYKTLSFGIGFIILSVTVSVAQAEVNTKPSTLDRSKVVIVDVGRENDDFDTRSSRKDLSRRIYRLEKAVRQLQEQIFDLTADNQYLVLNQKKYTCYVKTPLKGLFSATKTSLTEAKTAVMKDCTSSIKFGSDCDEDKIKCGE